uniref:Protein KTI12 homolog n=2 Tax=Schistocephalus solidus TaxID=70667 RepID=A0A0X3PVK7_SCHSO
MPLILLCGYPCSGKSAVVTLLAGCLHTHRPDCQIEVVSEESIASAHPAATTTIDPRVAIYMDANLEKQLRAEIKSQTERALTGKKPSNTIVIVDANNYIKGYRYELYCTAKSMRHQQAILHCTTGLDTCREINTALGRYPEAVFSEVVTRFERPNSSSRWDNPLYEICLPQELEQERDNSRQDLRALVDKLTDRILSELLSSGTRVRPNQSTVPTQAADSNYLQIVDLATTEVISAILAAQTNGADFASLPPHLAPPDSGAAPNLDLTDGFAWTASTLTKAKRQYLSFLRANATQLASTKKRTTPFEAAVLFMHFLNNEAQRTTFLS